MGEVEYFVLAMTALPPEDLVEELTGPKRFYIPPIGAQIWYQGNTYRVEETVPLHYDPQMPGDQDKLNVQFKGVRLT